MVLRSWYFVLVSAALLLGTVGGGWLHGHMIQRWGQAEALKMAAEQLQGGLPQRVGPWQLIKTHELEEGVVEVLQCAGYLHGVYTNDQTGDTIVVALVAGPSGPISVHTPEICYSAQDYEMAGDRQQVALRDSSSQIHTLWQIDARSRHAGRPHLRLLYGWSSGGAWQAASGPRFAFAGLPVLYKLQLAGPPDTHLSANSLDACQDFLSGFLSQIQSRLVNTSQVPHIIPHSLRKEP
jgi:hypothetical protein